MRHAFSMEVAGEYANNARSRTARPPRRPCGQASRSASGIGAAFVPILYRSGLRRAKSDSAIACCNIHDATYGAGQTKFPSLVFFVIVFLCSASAFAELGAMSSRGRLNTLSIEGDRVPVRTDVRLSAHDWRLVRGMDNMRTVWTTLQDGRSIWSGQIEMEKDKTCRIQEVVTETNGVVDITMTLTAESDLDLDGIYFWLDVPVSGFAGGICDLITGTNCQGSAVLPQTQPARRHFLGARSDRIVLAAPHGSAKLEVTLDRTCLTVVRDNRELKSDTYSAFFLLASGPIPKGQVIPIRVTMKVAGEPDRSTVRLSVDPKLTRYHLDGFGGNYCFNIESPVTQFTLDNLRVAWARTEMRLSDWEPQNDNDSPTNTNWEYLKGNDKPDSGLRRNFLLAKQLQGRQIPCVISIWSLPEWMYVDPGRDREVYGRRIAPDKWLEVLESVGTYLVHVKQEYGVEPELFCFNESDAGVRVRLSAEEHRQVIKLIGSHLEELGLKTKMLLGDTAVPRGSEPYLMPAANDPDAMRYVGAISFHSWGGATPDEYRAWRDVARSLSRPLLVAELGVDADAWRTASLFRSYDYGLREAEMYQEILLYAGPQGTMHWEFTSDYGLANEVKDQASGAVKVVPTSRFWLVKHFCNLTPPDADALTTTSDNPKVTFTAFAAGKGDKLEYSLHILNTGAGRHATISGLPGDVKSLRAVRTSELESFKELGPVPVVNGTIVIELPAQSLLTLTTMKVKD